MKGSICKADNVQTVGVPPVGYDVLDLACTSSDVGVPGQTCIANGLNDNITE